MIKKFYVEVRLAEGVYDIGPQHAKTTVFASVTDAEAQAIAAILQSIKEKDNLITIIEGYKRAAEKISNFDADAL